MTTVTPLIVLTALVKHETLTLPDLQQEKNLGTYLPPQEVELALETLTKQKFVTTLQGVTPTTYTITEKGIEESERISLKQEKVFS